MNIIRTSTSTVNRFNPQSPEQPPESNQWLLPPFPYASRKGDESLQSLLSDWPVPRPAHWVRHVNRPMTEEESDAIKICISRNRPYGNGRWQEKQVKQLGLSHTMRREGRPRKSDKTPKPKN